MRRSILLLLVFVATPLAAAQRVVLLSIDGGSDVVLDRLLASGALKGGAFERMARHGFAAASMTPAAVSSTPVSHATMFSGTWPGRHGIAGVNMPGEDLGGDLRNGFAAPAAVDRLWTVAQQAGKRVVCIAAPGAEATSPATTCSETIPFNTISRAQSLGGSGADLASRTEQALGPSPGAASGPLATTGQINEEEYVAREERFAEYVGNAVKLELARGDWDLLLVYVPIIDGLGHRYLLDDPRQAEYGDESGARRKRFADFIARGYRKMDAILGSWLAASPDTNFIVVSDHGMVPTHSVVLLNNALAAAGLRVSGADAEVRAISSGASAQVYVNSKRRFAHGIVADADVPGVVARITGALRELRDPLNGRRIIQTLASGSQLAALHLASANAGDVYASAAPGWGFTGRFDPNVPTVVPSTLSPDARARVSRSPAERQFLEKGNHNELSAGVHGHRPGDPRSQAIFYAIGPAVPRAKGRVAAMVDVAPTVLRALGVPVPSFMEGRPLFVAR